MFPRRIEGQCQGLLVLHNPETAQRVRVGERIGRRRDRSGAVQAPGGDIFQQRLGGLGGQVIGQSEKRVLGRASDVLDPIQGDTNARQVLERQRAENLAGGAGAAGGDGAAISSTRSRTSTIWMAPVRGCASIRRRSAQA